MAQKLSHYRDLSIENVELGVCRDINLNISKIIERFEFNYIVHHYFPPPTEEFIINLSSTNNRILTKSIKQIYRSIGFCSDFNIEYLSFHSGFRLDPDLNFNFPKKKPIESYEDTFNRFLQSLKDLGNYAFGKNVKLAIENNILTKYNLVNNKNEILLMCEEWEFNELYKKTSPNFISILLDLAHLKVTANTLNFDPNSFIMNLKNKVSAVHISENNGLKDEAKFFKKGDWVLEALKDNFWNKNIPMVWESRFQDENQLERALTSWPHLIR